MKKRLRCWLLEEKKETKSWILRANRGKVRKKRTGEEGLRVEKGCNEKDGKKTDRKARKMTGKGTKQESAHGGRMAEWKTSR